MNAAALRGGSVVVGTARRDLSAARLVSRQGLFVRGGGALPMGKWVAWRAMRNRVDNNSECIQYPICPL